MKGKEMKVTIINDSDIMTKIKVVIKLSKNLPKKENSNTSGLTVEFSQMYE